MFLSKLEVNHRSREVQRDLNDPYEMHRTLSRAWLETHNYEAARVLFRVDELYDGRSIVIVQSLTAPHWASLPANYCLSDPQQKEWTPRLTNGQSLSFRLQANPTVKREGKRRGLYRQHEQLQWLKRKAALCGFALPLQEIEVEGEALQLPAVRIAPLGGPMREKRENGKTVHFQRVQAKIGSAAGESKKNDGLFCAARFDGVLRITDEAAFLKALEGGIGSGKGLGFGLLSLAKA